MGGKRVFELILEIGHTSAPLNKKLPNGYTHKWTAFVRGVNNSKIEHCIQRVVFQLHESFPTPYRVISEPPFEIKETGYAGFEIPIQIYFKNREKPNFLGFVHDLVLLTNKPNDASTTEKIKFINPNREFEKCLIKSGAQLLAVAVKKERSNSPPAKKQKSSSLIPSKDMSKQPQLQPQIQSQPQTQTQHAQPHQSQPQQHAHHNKQQNQNHHASSNHHHHHHNHHHHHHHQPKQQSYQQQSQQQQQTSAPHKPKSTKSREFIDVFGAPLVFNSQDNGKTANDILIKQESKSSETHASKHESRNYDIHIKYETKSNNELHNKHDNRNNDNHSIKHEIRNNNETHSKHESKSNRHNKHDTRKEQVDIIKDGQLLNDPLQIIQTKISCLSDCDRLQKIVDIVEEAGEWYNLTPKKFEFDLKRLNKKTLHRIERCLQH